MQEIIDKISQKIKDNMDTDKYLYRCGLHDAKEIILKSQQSSPKALSWEECLDKAAQMGNYESFSKAPHAVQRDYLYKVAANLYAQQPRAQDKNTTPMSQESLESLARQEALQSLENPKEKEILLYTCGYMDCFERFKTSHNLTFSAALTFEEALDQSRDLFLKENPSLLSAGEDLMYYWRKFRTNYPKSFEIITQAAELFMLSNRQQRWIPVEERLPDFNTEVLAVKYPKHPTMDGKPMVGIAKRIDTTGVAGKNVIDRTLDENQFAYGRVILWQPLPEISKK